VDPHVNNYFPSSLSLSTSLLRFSPFFLMTTNGKKGYARWVRLAGEESGW
jgi:hypothetical protein